MLIAALFIAEDGPYMEIEAVDPWTESRDARNYAGPYPVVAHPPCERWGRYWSGGPSAKVKRKLGDDGGCFEAALKAVRKYGGVLEHPAYSHAWKHFDLPRPDLRGGWWGGDEPNEWVCHVEQGHYGHRARKATWLYAITLKKPPEFRWGPSKGERLDEGFHSTQERRSARAAGKKPIKRLSKKECVHTPIEFARELIRIVRNTPRRSKT